MTKRFTQTTLLPSSSLSTSQTTPKENSREQHVFEMYLQYYLQHRRLFVTDIDGHKVAVAQRIHVFQHVALIKDCILQPQLAEQTAVMVIPYREIVPNTDDFTEIKRTGKR